MQSTRRRQRPPPAQGILAQSTQGSQRPPPTQRYEGSTRFSRRDRGGGAEIAIIPPGFRSKNHDPTGACPFSGSPFRLLNRCAAPAPVSAPAPAPVFGSGCGSGSRSGPEPEVNSAVIGPMKSENPSFRAMLWAESLRGSFLSYSVTGRYTKCKTLVRAARKWDAIGNRPFREGPEILTTKTGL